MTIQREIQSNTDKVNFEDKVLPSFKPQACSAPISLVYLKTWHKEKEHKPFQGNDTKISQRMFET
jgi:hypothetical protein